VVAARGTAARQTVDQRLALDGEAVAASGDPIAPRQRAPRPWVVGARGLVRAARPRPGRRLDGLVVAGGGIEIRHDGRGGAGTESVGP
jgi:hypothetical protein